MLPGYPEGKLTTSNSTMILISEKREEEISLLRRDMTTTGAGKRQHQQRTVQLLFWANLSTEVSPFLRGFLILCRAKEHFSVFVQHHLPHPESLDLNFTFSGYSTFTRTANIKLFNTFSSRSYHINKHYMHVG